MTDCLDIVRHQWRYLHSHGTDGRQQATRVQRAGCQDCTEILCQVAGRPQDSRGLCVACEIRCICSVVRKQCRAMPTVPGCSWRSRCFVYISFRLSRYCLHCFLAQRMRLCWSSARPISSPFALLAVFDFGCSSPFLWCINSGLVAVCNSANLTNIRRRCCLLYRLYLLDCAKIPRI